MLSYGKYKGWDMEEVPDDYVQYMMTAKRKDLELWEAEWTRRELVQEAQMPWELKLISAGKKALAIKCHPDHGGNTADMQAINAAAARIEQTLRSQQNGGTP